MTSSGDTFGPRRSNPDRRLVFDIRLHVKKIDPACGFFIWQMRLVPLAGQGTPVWTPQQMSL